MTETKRGPDQHEAADEVAKMTDEQVQGEYGHLIRNAAKTGEGDHHQTLIDNGGYSAAIVAERKKRGLK